MTRTVVGMRMVLAEATWVIMPLSKMRAPFSMVGPETVWMVAPTSAMGWVCGVALGVRSCAAAAAVSRMVAMVAVKLRNGLVVDLRVMLQV